MMILQRLRKAQAAADAAYADALKKLTEAHKADPCGPKHGAALAIFNAASSAKGKATHRVEIVGQAFEIIESRQARITTAAYLLSLSDDQGEESNWLRAENAIDGTTLKRET